MTAGWAGEPWALDHLLATLDPPYAVVDAWTPPHPLALAVDLCEELLTLAAATASTAGGNGTYHLLDVPPAARVAIVARFERANDLWWQLDIDRWEIHAKRYRPGEGHPPHQDLHPTASTRKIAGSVQLSEPASYLGGDLVVSFAQHRLTMPRDLGALVGIPGWTVHEVTPVAEGTRWALIVNGFGPPLR